MVAIDFERFTTARNGARFHVNRVTADESATGEAFQLTIQSGEWPDDREIVRMVGAAVSAFPVRGEVTRHVGCVTADVTLYSNSR
jgi:hypothetical protein